MSGRPSSSRHSGSASICTSGPISCRAASGSVWRWRALANDPALILADEPTGSLDSQASEQVFDILQDVVENRGKTVVAVTHELDLPLVWTAAFS